MTTTEWTSNQTRSTTYTLSADELLRGSGSKQIVLESTANPILSVASNLSNPDETAIIENLVIWGNGSNTAIELSDVYNCKIRNVTIRNCDTGIKLTATSNNFSQANSIEHVRMYWVNRGIKFDQGAGTGDFKFTHIDNVGISLRTDQSNLNGIEVGTGCKIYSSFIKANVWSATTCIGMYVNGQVKYSLVNFNHERTTGTGGTGVYISSSGVVSDNQNFFLAAGQLGTSVSNNSSPHVNDNIISATY